MSRPTFLRYNALATWLGAALLACLFPIACQFPIACATGAEPNLEIVPFEQGVKIVIDKIVVAQYFHQFGRTTRPFLAHVTTRSGQPVTRNFPPRKPHDLDDHADLHPGIWLSFGDINGEDYWRLKAPVRFQRFVAEPRIDSDTATFTVLNHYLSSDESQLVCEEECTIRVQTFERGYLIHWTSQFHSDHGPIRFGDQEEMGLGVRVATSLSVDAQQGGRILDNEGRRNGDQVWGMQARWCDYSGPTEPNHPTATTWSGLTIMASPKNHRASWSHARDYGFVALNPFGISTFGQQPRDDKVIPVGERFTLGYALAVHESPREADFDPESVYRQAFSLPPAPLDGRD